jgi:leucyl-tRNA synthetase
VHSKVKQIGGELSERMHVNTCVAAIMSLLNELEGFAASSAQAVKSAAWQEGVRTLLLLLAPFAPHITEELWSRIGDSGSIHEAPWPDYDESALRRNAVTIVVQVDGRRRGTIDVPPGSDEEAVLAQALALPTVRAQLDGKKVRRKIYVPDRLLNIVVAAG